MPILSPGKRDRRGRHAAEHRALGADLNLTPMIDVFTVLVIFLLQNYGQSTELLFIPKNVELPKASQVKELAPAHLVTITQDHIVLDKDIVADLKEVKEKTAWDIPNLRQKLQAIIEMEKQIEAADIKKSLRSAVPTDPNSKRKEKDVSKGSRVTVQADKEMDFLTVKKVMFSVTEAGAGEINFAVTKLDKPLE